MAEFTREQKLQLGKMIAMPPLPPEDPAAPVIVVPPPSTNPMLQHHPEPEQADIVVPQDEVAIAAPAQEAPVEETPAPSPKEQNFRAVRERATALERERDEMARELQKYKNVRLPEIAPEEDDHFDIGNDDLAEGKHLKKILSKQAKLEKQLWQYQQQAEVSSIESRLKSQYPDFDHVVSPENIETLRLTDPDTANSIAADPDLYRKAVVAYKTIKRQGISGEDPTRYAEDVARAQANAKKPKPLASMAPQAGQTPLSQANAFAQGMTKDLQQQLFKEMKDAVKGY